MCRPAIAGHGKSSAQGSVVNQWEWLAIAADGATVVTGVAVVFALVQFFQTRKQRCRDADQWYVDRYWFLQDQKSAKWQMNGTLRSVVPLRVLHAELRLCEDELDARANGWVTNGSWAIWSPSILAFSKDQRAMAVLRGLPKEELTRLRAFISDEQDPQEIGILRQLWRGIR